MTIVKEMEVSLKVAVFMETVSLSKGWVVLSYGYEKCHAESGMVLSARRMVTAVVTAEEAERLNAAMQVDPEGVFTSLESKSPNVHRNVYRVADVMAGVSTPKPVVLSSLFEEGADLLVSHYCVQIPPTTPGLPVVPSYWTLEGAVVLRPEYTYGMGFLCDLPGGREGLSFKSDYMDVYGAISALNALGFKAEYDESLDGKGMMCVTISMTDELRGRVLAKQAEWERWHEASTAAVASRGSLILPRHPLIEFGVRALVYDALLHDVLIPFEA